MSFLKTVKTYIRRLWCAFTVPTYVAWFATSKTRPLGRVGVAITNMILLASVTERSIVPPRVVAEIGVSLELLDW